jgi:dihydroxyacid dehydratase/phosphogluconate dehydratase
MRNRHRAPEPPGRVRLWRDHREPGAERRDIVSVFRGRRWPRSGQSRATRNSPKVERTAIPGPGSCGGMYTANTMASAIEALGLSLPDSSAQEAIGNDKASDCRRAPARPWYDSSRPASPSMILTRKAFENAITVTIAVGGSTNAVLHLLAIARAAKVRPGTSTTSPVSASACRCWRTSGPAGRYVDVRTASRSAASSR